MGGRSGLYKFFVFAAIIALRFFVSEIFPNKTAIGVLFAAEKTKIATSKQNRNRSYFSKIDEAIVSAVEDGSPASIRMAMNNIRKAESEYSDAEKVLISIATKFMAIIWPSEKISWDVPAAPENTPYTAALSFVERGLFDSSTGNIDFLSTIIPALVIFDDNISPQTLTQCESALQNALLFNQSATILDYMFARLYDKKGDYQSAKTFYDRLYSKNQTVFEIRYNYAQNAINLCDFENANYVAASLLSDFPANLDVLKLNAKVSFQIGEYDKAEEYVARVLQQTPNNLEFLLFRAKILVEKKDYIHAVALLDMYARHNPTNIDYLLLRTTVQLDWSRNTQGATETVEKALSLYPENTEALLLAARIASQSDSPVAGKYADELVSKILSADSENVEALLYALDGLIQRHEWISAYENSKKLISKNPLDGKIVPKHVEVCLALEKKSEALSCAQTAYNANPADEAILQSYILAEISSSSAKQSLSLINSLLDSASPKIKSYLYYQRSFFQGTESATLADLRSSLTSNPRNSDALFRLYEIYFEKEDYKKAQYYLKQVVALKPNDTSVKKLNESLTKLLQ